MNIFGVTLLFEFEKIFLLNKIKLFFIVNFGKNQLVFKKKNKGKLIFIINIKFINYINIAPYYYNSFYSQYVNEIFMILKHSYNFYFYFIFLGKIE
jgi:hypothetical protein